MYRLLPVLNVLGMLLFFFGATYLLPIACSVIYSDGTASKFIYAMLICFGIGFLLWLLTFKHKRELQLRDGFLLVSLTWVLIPAIASIPLLLTISNLTFTDAFFESMSGLTTTGSTILVGIDKLPHAVNLWRHELNWLGGMGIILLAVAILPLLGVGGMQLYKAESSGPMKDSKLTPRIANTAKALWFLYFSLTAACIISLKLAGMNWFDAICHGFATLALGGFSTHDASVGHFNSPTIEAVIIVFMLIAGINFTTHFVALHGRNVKVYWKDSEAKAFLALIITSTLVCATYLWYQGTYAEWLTALRHVSFNLVSMASGSGFVSQEFGKWPMFVPLWMLFLATVAVSSGSAGGGIKMMRTLILAKQSLRELQKLIHPNVVNPIYVNGMLIPDSIAGAVLGFVFLYVLTIVELTFFQLASGLDFVSAFSAVVACLTNSGVALGVVVDNFKPLTDFQTWICSLAMLVGRLEIFSIAVLFTPYFWRQ
ncbi:MAG: potassium transporter TrkG [Pseudomonadota bacterium]